MASDRQEKQAALDRHQNMVDSTNSALAESGQTALKGLFLMNGGALVALLGLIGVLVDGALGTNIVASLLPAMKAFASGVGFIGVAYASTYLTNFCYVSSLINVQQIEVEPYVKMTRRGRVFHWVGLSLHAITLLLGIASIGAFLLGFSEVAAAFENL